MCKGCCAEDFMGLEIHEDKYIMMAEYMAISFLGEL